MKRIILAVLALMLLPVFAEAVTRYAVPPGTGGCSNGSTNYVVASNSCTGGTAATVHTNINSAINAMSGGDSLYIRTGTYVQPTVSVPGGTTLTAGAGATLISRYQSEVVTLTPPGGGTSFLYCPTGPSGTQRYIILDGLIWDGVDKSAETGINGGCDHIRFIRMEIKRNLNSGVFGGTNNEYQFNIIHDNGTRSNASGVECTTVGCGSPQDHGMYVQGPDNIVEDNIIYNNWGAGLHLHAPSVQNHRNIVRRNVVYNNGVGQGVGGIVVDSGDDNQVYGNITYGHNGGAGIWLSSGLNRTMVYNNTSYNNSGDYQIKIEVSSAANTAIKNNIMVPGAGIGSLLNNGTSTTQDHNYCASGCTGTGTINSATDPFVNKSGVPPDFHLVPGSAAIDAGTPNISAGITIPACSGGTTVGCYNGPNPDMGALETGVPTVGGGPPTITPNLTSVVAGAQIILTVDDDDVNERIEDVGDWVGIFEPGVSGYVDWFYMNGTKTAPTTPISDAVIPFTAPLILGLYEFRFYRNGSSLEVDRLATAAFSVIAPGIVMKFNVSALKIGPSITWKIGTP